MHGLSSNTGRLTPPKIEIRCTCGKQYRVSADKAGKKVRCKNCRLKIQVPAPDGTSGRISLRTRRAILEEFGIDAEQAQHEYEARKNGYTCNACNVVLEGDALKQSYGEEGLLCAGCRAAQAAARDLEREEKAKKKEPKKLDRWSSGKSAADVKRKAYALSGLFLVGTACFVHQVLSPHPIVTGLVACAVALVGGLQVFKAEYVPEADD